MSRGVDPHLFAGLAWLQVAAERRRISQLQQELHATRQELEAAQNAALVATIHQPLPPAYEFGPPREQLPCMAAIMQREPWWLEAQAKMKCETEEKTPKSTAPLHQAPTPREAAKKLHQEIKDKWRQPGPRIPPMPK